MNSRRWLTLRRQSLYSDDDHLSPSASVVLPDRREIKSRISNQYATDYSIFCKMKALEAKTKQTLVFDPGGYTGRLRSCPFFGNVARVCVGRFSFGRRMVPEAEAFLADG